MLYDNALLILAYCKAHELTGRALYLDIAEKTAGFVLREMTGPDGGFYSAQDADSEGEEGRFYVFTPDEIERLLGPTDGPAFCERFGITREGNFGAKSITEPPARLGALREPLRPPPAQAARIPPRTGAACTRTTRS